MPRWMAAVAACVRSSTFSLLRMLFTWFLTVCSAMLSWWAICLLGRPFTMSDETSHATVAVLSYAYSKRHLALGCGVLGHLIYVKGVPFTIIGVAAENFHGIENRATDIWVPLQNRPDLNAWGNNQKGFYADPNWWCLYLLGRLQPGIYISL